MNAEPIVKMPQDTPSDAAVIRLPATTKERKRAYLRAAAGRPLVEWIWETLDREAAKI